MSRRAAKEKLKDARQALYREHILDAAEQTFAEHGYEEAKVASMAATAGVSLATVYRSFEAKWDIYRAVHAHRTAELNQQVGAHIAGVTDPLELLLGGIAGYIEFHMQHPDYLRMHLRDGHAWSTSSMLRSPEQKEAWNQGFAMTAAAFTAAIRSGLCVDDEGPELMARTMIAMHQVRLADWVDHGMLESVETLTEAVHRQFVRTFCTTKGAASHARSKRPRR